MDSHRILFLNLQFNGYEEEKKYIINASYALFHTKELSKILFSIHSADIHLFHSDFIFEQAIVAPNVYVKGASEIHEDVQIPLIPNTKLVSTPYLNKFGKSLCTFFYYFLKTLKEQMFYSSKEKCKFFIYGTNVVQNCKILKELHEKMAFKIFSYSKPLKMKVPKNAEEIQSDFYMIQRLAQHGMEARELAPTSTFRHFLNDRKFNWNQIKNAGYAIHFEILVLGHRYCKHFANKKKRRNNFFFQTIIKISPWSSSSWSF